MRSFGMSVKNNWIYFESWKQDFIDFGIVRIYIAVVLSYPKSIEKLI